MSKDKIKALFSDDVFVKKLLSRETPEEVQLLLEEQKIFISIEEILNFKEQVKQKLSQISDGSTEFELTEEELEHIAGGVFPEMTIVPMVIAAMFYDSQALIGSMEQNSKERW